MKLLHTGTVSDGRLILSNRKRFDDDVKQFEGKRVEVVISKLNKRRSNDQNSYYWACVIPVAQKGMIDAGYLGITTDEVHDFFKREYLTEGIEIVNPNTGEIKTLNKTTTILSTTQMKDYIEQISLFCSEWLNVVIPEPMEIFR